MSEFRQATAYMAALEEHVTVLQQSITGNIDHGTLEDSLSSILAAIEGEVNSMMEKQRDRCSMVDPVTRQPRLGPKTLANVQDLLRRYDAVKLVMEVDAPLRLQVETTICHFKEEEIARKEEEAARERNLKAAQQAAELKRDQEQVRIRQEARDREERQRRNEQLRIKELATAAQKKREEREKERTEAKRQRKVEEQERERLNASISRGKVGLEKSIAMLRESTGSEVLYRQSLEKLFSVVSNICSSPENVAFRRIVKDNANFHADLGQYAGGHQCLLAMGFKELQQGDETQPRTVFSMEEPDLSEDLDAWSDWFDELKEIQRLVESKLQ
uniref:PUB domain-containing protein n=1 Tax=Peronospora matthiolae TaxID=2874970 RepID=A0AAV1UDM9_9STRA